MDSRERNQRTVGSQFYGDNVSQASPYIIQSMSRLNLSPTSNYYPSSGSGDPSGVPHSSSPFTSGFGPYRGQSGINEDVNACECVNYDINDRESNGDVDNDAGEEDGGFNTLADGPSGSQSMYDRAYETLGGTDGTAGFTQDASTELVNQAGPLSAGSERRITPSLTPQGKTLDPEYRVHRGKDFTFGRIVALLWSEPMGQSPDSKAETKGTELVRHAKYGENCYSSIRRFLIVSPREGHCLCLPILTYGGKATKKRGVKPQDHAIIYTQTHSKDSKPTEERGEQALTKKAIRVVPKSPREKLDPLSRLNYAKIYTIEYNVKVKFIGEVHPKSTKYVKRDFNISHAPLPEDPSAEFSDTEEQDTRQR